ncbi:MAG: hypothetical protein U1F43_16115 [Myxococcota bacterium]
MRLLRRLRRLDTCDGVVSATDTTACSSAVPDGWTCSPSWFGDGDCDCGCGAKDNDCANTTDVAICDYCVDCQTAFEDCSTVVDAADTTACVQSDCGDGQVTGREDCDGTNLGGSSCTSLGFESGDLGCNDDCTFDLRLCVAPAVPDGWTCDATWYGDGDCDCGCGAQDFDCLGTSDVGECDFCIDCPGSGDCAARVDNADTTQCGGGVDGWTCDPTWFGDGDCDCGCGVQDRDCAGTTDVSECVACSPCSGPSPDCADRVDNADTTQCAASEVPLDWTCSASWYGDGSCDCGCGVQDLDCAGTTGIGECDYCIDCGAAVGDSCAGFVVPTDTTQCQPTDCGDRIVSGGEDCDGDNLGGATCLTLGFDGGTLGCNIDCSFDTIGCTRPVVPSGWACPDSYYGDADCDCGCGVQDIDCATDDDVRECDFCTNCPGAGDCSTKVDNSDTTLCSDVVVVPDGWTCNDAWYADGSCDCGCGIQDFDCAASDDVTECAFCSDCAGTGDCTARVDDADTTQCLNAVPTDWTCSPAFYGDGSCDCGCGVQDLDCADTTTVAACEYCEGCGVTAGDSCDGSVEPSDTTACVAGAVPSGWTCDATWYGDGDCDCGCGVQDFDCSGTSDASECDYCIACPSNGSVDCADRVDGGDTTQCAVPGGWTCDPAWFGDGDCDCGCGAQDQDCGSTSDATECDFCTACGAAAGDSCGDFVDAGDTTLCAGTLPDGWSCSPSYYGDGDCDCGCGAQDSDCAATDDVTQCDFCDACPAGLSSACADIVDNGDTTLCADAAPDGWACDPAWYSDGDCDCGCGVQDADCATTDDATECAFCTVCGAASTDSCVDFVDARDTTQCFSACGNGVIDPGEQCEKTDLDGVTCTSLGFDGGELGCSDRCTFDTSLCVVPPLPADWTCVDTWFGDGDCDCGCGAPDVDCASTDDATECTYCIDCPGAGGDCIDRVDHADTTTCLPDGWRCDASFYDDTDCDCGCGAQDADCASTTSVAQCDFCDACGARPEDACADYILATDTTLCLVECGNGVVDGSEACDGSDLDGETCVTQGFAGGDLACDALCGFDTSGCLSDVPPFDWTCSATWYGDGDCDCGCGAQDVDCAGTADANECDYCIACPGSGTCLDRVDSHDTTQCSATGAVPADWACPEAYFGDGTCDCGCGAQDSDCASTSDVTECLYCDACGVPFGDDCSTAVDAGDTTICQ